MGVTYPLVCPRMLSPRTWSPRTSHTAHGCTGLWALSPRAGLTDYTSDMATPDLVLGAHAHQKTRTCASTAALITTGLKETAQRPPPGEHVHGGLMEEQNSANHRNSQTSAPWKNLIDALLRERRQPLASTSCMLPVTGSSEAGHSEGVGQWLLPVGGLDREEALGTLWDFGIWVCT